MDDRQSGRFEVHNSGAMADKFIRLQRIADAQGRGSEFLTAAESAYERMRNDPFDFGEPLYRLPKLLLQVRCAVIRPLRIDFAVCENRPVVFIKNIHLLASHGPEE
jgi:hypothetical protein